MGDISKEQAAKLAALQNEKEDTSCGFAEEGQAAEENVDPSTPAIGGDRTPESAE